MSFCRSSYVLIEDEVKGKCGTTLNIEKDLVTLIN